MKRKMLISIALIMIMLLNCMMPILVNAVEGEEIQLNSKLYNAVKTSLSTQGVTFSADDITHTITLSNSDKSSVKELNLNEGSISDLSGLEAFTELTHLELSGNNLTRESNLGVLNSLSKLNYLDLSTNQLEDVNEISDLISKLQGTGTIILSGQSVNLVETVYVDSEEDSDNTEKATFELPAILELAGYIKSCWKSTNGTPEEAGETAPFLNVDSVPMYVTPESNKIEVNIAADGGAPAYLGLLELTIYIYDDATEAASAKNPNKAAENILNGSKFKLYYVVHDKSSEAVTTMDTNLYNAIKEQLTAGQTKNKALASYPYSVDRNGEVIYEEYTYTTSGNYRILTNIRTGKADYKYDAKENVLRLNDSSNKIVNLPVEATVIPTVDGNGNISAKQGYKIPFVGREANTTLYIQAYDQAKTFVIDDSVLTNKITSLILNNEQIRDLSGIEYFIGLTSKLNVSHNYLEDIEAIYTIDAMKDYWESQIIDKYNQYLKTRKYGNLAEVMKEIKEAKETTNKNIDEISKASDSIIAILGEAVNIDRTNEKYNDEIQSKVNAIEAILAKVEGSRKEDGSYEAGYKDLISGNNSNDIEGSTKEITKNVGKMYAYLEKLYGIFNQEYKLTTLLVPNINYITYSEYETYQNAIKSSAESARALVEEEVNFLKTLEAENGLSDLDKKLLTKYFGINFDANKKDAKPLAEFFEKYLKENALSRTQSIKLLDAFREMNLYSEMANYCLIKRMNEDTPAAYCYEIEYLENRIKELEEEEDLPTDLEMTVLEKLESNVTENNSLYSVYVNYTKEKYTYGSKTISSCEGPYTKLGSTKAEYVAYTTTELMTKALEAAKSTDTTNQSVLDVLNKIGTGRIIKVTNLYETEESGNNGEAGKTFLYNQVSSLANKLLNGEVNRYVKLPRLKDLDISYNAELYDIDRIAELKTLRNLNASYCYIADLKDINWVDMPNLKKLSLAYNYISDITAITNVPNLKELDLSNNLISGKLNITEQQYIKLFKKMEEFNLAGNQITDIENLLIYLDYVSNGNYANYLAREDTLNINLNNQKIDLEIQEPITLSAYPTTIDVELPKIFTQLLAIDVARTGFGETSQNGRIESEGKYVTLNTRTAGEKQGKVVVLPMNGNGEKFDTCIGNGTTATIKYSVQESGIKTVRINPSSVEARNGQSINFTAVVEADEGIDKSVTWSIEGNTSRNTSISANGQLTIASDEKSQNITVIARAKADSRLMDMASVSLPSNKPTEPDVPDNTTKPDNTTNTENTVGPDNPGNITPDNNVDPEKPAKVIDTSKLGYKVGEEYLNGVAAKTPVTDFKTILLNGLQYNVVVTKDEVTVTSGNMATGMYVKILDENGNIVKDQNGDLVVYQVVVKGDVNGDGVADSLDSNLIKAYRVEVTDLTGANFEAADINSDGKIDVSDSKLLLYHRAEVNGYDLNYSKK